ncbi:MAG: phytoene desaturase family protein, partial [Salinispira sp.]
PSLLTLAGYFSDIFAYSAADFTDYINLKPLNPITHYFFSDGSQLYSRPLPYFLDEIENFAPSDREGMERYFQHSRVMYEISDGMFLRNPINHWKDGGIFQSVRNLSLLGSMDLFRTMNQASSSFVQDWRLRQFLNRFATYNGSDPFRAPAALHAIAWVEHGLPVYVPEGGIVEIPRALEKRCIELGVNFHYSHELMELQPHGMQHQGSAWKLLFRGGSSFSAAHIILDIDIRIWYTHIMKKMAGQSFQNKINTHFRGDQSRSAIVFFWGINAAFSELNLHNVFFSSNYEKEFHEIHKEHMFPSDPTIYVHITSKNCSTDAPPERENWFVMVNAPCIRKDSRANIELLRRTVLRKLSGHLGRNVEALIEEERILTPELIEEETGSYRGSLYGMSSNSILSAFRRHPNTSPYFTGIYHCGGSVHPGGGMPLALSSGIIAAKSFLKNNGGKFCY